LENPVVARLAEDTVMRAVFHGGDVVLLDRAESRRRVSDATSYYAVEHLHEGLIRRLRRGSRGLYLIPESGGGDYISLRDENILEIVKARVVWYGHYVEPIAPRPTQETG
jgi:hypothetical protein